MTDTVTAQKEKEELGFLDSWNYNPPLNEVRRIIRSIGTERTSKTFQVDESRIEEIASKTLPEWIRVWDVLSIEDDQKFSYTLDYFESEKMKEDEARNAPS